MRGCHSPGAGRCITAPGKVSGSRRFYVTIRGTAWSGGAVATATADAPQRSFTTARRFGRVGRITVVPFSRAAAARVNRRFHALTGISQNACDRTAADTRQVSTPTYV
jgi:hypothetical protein